MGKLCQIFTELSARNTIMAGYYSLRFYFVIFSDERAQNTQMLFRKTYNHQEQLEKKTVVMLTET